MKSNITKAQLIAVATELNKLMELSPPIKTTGKGVNVKNLESDIRKACGFLEPHDELSAETLNILTVLGVSLSGEGTKDDPKPPEDKPKNGNGKKPDKPKDSPKKAPVERSRYGHKVGSQAGLLDDLFWAGATIDDAVTKSGSSGKGRVLSHIKHLRDELGLTVTEKDGLYKVKQEKFNGKKA